MSFRRSRSVRWLVFLRIARREILRHPRRSVGTVALIALPVVTVIVGIVLWTFLTNSNSVALQQFRADPSIQGIITKVSPHSVNQNSAADEYWVVEGQQKTPTDDTALLTQWVGDKNSLRSVDTFDQVTLKRVSRSASHTHGTEESSSAQVTNDTSIVVLDAIQSASAKNWEIPIETQRDQLNAGEAVLTRDIATRMELNAGDVVEVETTIEANTTMKHVRAQVQIVEVVPGHGGLILGESTIEIARVGMVADPQTTWFVRGTEPVTWDQIRQLNTYGFTVISRDVLNNPPPDSDMHTHVADSDSEQITLWIRLVLIIGSLTVLAVMVLLVAPLFTSIQRSMMHLTAQLSVNGATRRDQGAVVLAYALVIGSVAAAFSLILTLAVLHVLLPPFGWEQSIPRAIPVVLSVILPVVLSVLASFIPSRAAATVRATKVIGGRVRFPSRLVVKLSIYPLILAVSIPMLIAAAVWGSVVLLVVGIGVFEVGLFGSVPYLFHRLRYRKNRVSVAYRVAMRDAVRSGHRTFPAMASILTVSFVSSALLVTFASTTAALWESKPHLGNPGQIFLRNSHSDATDVEKRAAQNFALETLKKHHSVIRRVELNGMPWNETPNGPSFVAAALRMSDSTPVSISTQVPRLTELDLAYIVDDGTYLEASGLADATEDAHALATLKSGGVLAPETNLIDENSLARIQALELHAQGESSSQPLYGHATVHAIGSFQAALFNRINLIVLSPQAATRLMLPVQLIGELVDVSHPVDPLAQKTLETNIEMKAPSVEVLIITQPRETVAMPYIAVIFTILSAVATVALVAILSSSELRSDLNTLEAIGATPWFHRQIAAYQGLILSLHCIPLGIFSGAGIGVLAVITLSQSAESGPLASMTPILPWPFLLVMLVGIPIVSTCVTTVLTPRTIERARRIS